MQEQSKYRPLKLTHYTCHIIHFTHSLQNACQRGIAWSATDRRGCFFCACPTVETCTRAFPSPITDSAHLYCIRDEGMREGKTQELFERAPLALMQEKAPTLPNHRLSTAGASSHLPVGGRFPGFPRRSGTIFFLLPDPDQDLRAGV